MCSIVLIAMLSPVADRADVASVRADLQGVYDEISEATLGYEPSLDVDDLHAVLYSPDWVFVDAKGRKRSWQPVRDDEVRALLDEPRLDWMSETIRKVTLTPGGASAIVEVATVRTVADEEGRHGRKGEKHQLTTTVIYRDNWSKTGDGWRMTMREQLGEGKVTVDRAPSYPEYLRQYKVIR